MKVKVSELEGGALDWAVAKAIDWPVGVSKAFSGWYVRDLAELSGSYSPCTNWSQGGPLIEMILSDGFELAPAYPDRFACSNRTDEGLPYSGDWEASEIREPGPTPLIAACRAIVAAKLGYTVEVPDQLT